MEQFEVTMRQFDKTMASYQAGSEFHHQLQQTLLEFKRLSEEIQPLTRGLNEQPNMFIFDKALPADPQPRKQ
jgi:paraquat-inducible protein B